MNSTTWVASPAWGVAGWTMLHYLWVGGVLAALATAGRRALLRAHPDVRYVYALAALTALAAAPAIIAWVISGGAPASPTTTRIAVGPVVLASGNAFVGTPAPPPQAAPSVGRLSLLSPAGTEPRPVARWLDRIAGALPAVWLVGAPLTFAYLAIGLVGADRLRRRSRPVSYDSLTALCERLAAALEVAHRLTVGVCDRVAAPMLLGIVRPLILLPPAALTGWTQEQVEMALLHELAHVRRRDNLVNLAQRLIESALFFHPAVWVVSGWVRHEREHCCDRVVVAHTGRALDYAETLFALSETAGTAITHGVYMARPPLVDRIRRILSPEDRTMKLSRTTVALAAALLVLPAVLVGTYAQKESRSAQPDGQASEKTSPENRRRRASEMYKASIRRREPNAPPWKPLIPAAIAIRVGGVARDEAGKAVSGATITLYPTTLGGAKPAGQATTDDEGRYIIRDAIVPVQTSFNGQPFPKEITPYAGFILSGLAPGLGISWSPAQSMYAVEEPHPDDIQGRLPLDRPVVLDLTFPRAASIKGKVADENGAPVEGAKLQVTDCDLLDDTGRETNNRQGYDWNVLPDRIGRAVTDRDGRLRIEGLADRACYWLFVHRPETENTTLGFYAATIDSPDTVHEELPAGSFNGRRRHDVKTGDLTVTFPKIRPIAVTVVGDDTGKPVAGAGVYTLNESLATGISSGGTTDDAGKALLGLPPGRYAGIRSDPPIASRYIRTNQRPLVVERGESAQPYEIRQKAGAELIIQAVMTRAGEPVAGAFFWKAPEDQPEETQHIETSTFRSGEPWTDTKGELRAVLPPEPGRRYRFRFAGVHEPNMPSGINPAAANKHGYEAFPTQSAPVELIAGKAIRLRFMFRKTD